MKRILISLLMVCMAISVNAQNGGDQYVDFQIVAQDNISTPIYRAPAMIPVRGYYAASSETLYLSFSYDMGIIDVRYVNLSTGEYTVEYIPTDSGVYAVVFGSNPGLYRIFVSTQSGQQYFSEFQL